MKFIHGHMAKTGCEMTIRLHDLVEPHTCGCLVTEETEGGAAEGEVGEGAETEDKEKDEDKEEKESQEEDAAKGLVLTEFEGLCAHACCG